MILRSIILVLLLTFFWSSLRLEAQTQAFEAGYQAYMRNQFPLAEANFKRALNDAETKEDKAFILKFLGIAQFMRGDRKQAAISFYQAYTNDPSTSIYNEEVLDPSVVQFYNSLKSRWVQARQQEAQQPRPPGASPNRAVSENDRNQRSGSDASRPPANRRSNRPPQRTEAKAEKKASTLSWLHFMPFGVGQYYNGQYIVGTAFLAAQLGSGYIYFFREDQIVRKQNEIDEVRESDLYSEEDKELYFEDSATYLSVLRGDQDLALIGFGLSWGLGILHAILTAPGPNKGDGLIQNQWQLPSTPALASKEGHIDYWYVAPASPRDRLSFHPGRQGSWLVNLSMSIH